MVLWGFLGQECSNLSLVAEFEALENCGLAGADSICVAQALRDKSNRKVVF